MIASTTKKKIAVYSCFIWALLGVPSPNTMAIDKVENDAKSSNGGAASSRQDMWKNTPQKKKKLGLVNRFVGGVVDNAVSNAIERVEEATPFFIDTINKEMLPAVENAAKRTIPGVLDRVEEMAPEIVASSIDKIGEEIDRQRNFVLDLFFRSTEVLIKDVSRSIQLTQMMIVTIMGTCLLSMVYLTKKIVGTKPSAII